MYDIAGKVALVTGGAKGIGRAYCIALVKQGANVVVVDRDAVSGEELTNYLNQNISQGSSFFVECDVTNRHELKASFDASLEHFGKMDIVINNAGTVDETEQGWRRTVEVNLVAVIEGCRLAISRLKPGGVIVNTSSLAATRDSTFPIYSATKGGVTGLSKSLGAPRCFDVTGIRVMTIQPGLTLTTLVSKGLDDKVWIQTPQDSFKHRMDNVYPSQSADIVADCLIDVLQNGDSGSVWNVDGGKWSNVTGMLP